MIGLVHTKLQSMISFHLIAVDCGVPKDIENGSFKGFGTKFNDNYYAECMNGYILSGSKEITCLADGKWNNQPKCTRKTLFLLQNISSDY